MTGKPIGIIGGGAWGTALANAVASSGKAVALWMRDPEAAADAELSRSNARYLPGARLLDPIGVTSKPQTLAAAETVLLVVPTQGIRAALDGFAGILPDETPLVVCAKGIERGSNLFPSEIVRELRPNAPIAILSGPSFAADVARGLPTAVALAASDDVRARQLAADLSGPALRVYHGTDVRGVEIGGAAKNVLAIAVGIVEGRRLGESAKAALTARGFAELLRFAQAYGGRPATLMGLSGLGDLVLTCGSTQSRNFSLGLRIGTGTPTGDARAGKLAEGAFTADALVDLARQRHVEMPIAEAVAAVLTGTRTVDEAVESLMTRPLKAE